MLRDSSGPLYISHHMQVARGQSKLRSVSERPRISIVMGCGLMVGEWLKRLDGGRVEACMAAGTMSQETRQRLMREDCQGSCSPCNGHVSFCTKKLM